jgi:putative addiction module component (TIGR02574 family)
MRNVPCRDLRTGLIRGRYHERQRRVGDGPGSVGVYVRRLVRYIWAMAIEAVLQQVLKMPADERAELVEHLIDSLEAEEVELSAEELAHLDEAIADADRAVEHGELIPAEAVLAQMRQIS